MRRSGRAFIQPFCMFQSITEFLTALFPVSCGNPRTRAALPYITPGMTSGRSPHAR